MAVLSLVFWSPVFILIGFFVKSHRNCELGIQPSEIVSNRCIQRQDYSVTAAPWKAWRKEASYTRKIKKSRDDHLTDKGLNNYTDTFSLPHLQKPSVTLTCEGRGWIDSSHLLAWGMTAPSVLMTRQRRESGLRATAHRALKRNF